MAIIEFLAFVCFVLLLMYWLSSMRAKDIVKAAGQRSCKDNDVFFLDQTVALDKVRFHRKEDGNITLRRWYVFEFSSDGDRRYQGRIVLTGRIVDSVEMDAWRIVDSGF